MLRQSKSLPHLLLSASLLLLTAACGSGDISVDASTPNSGEPAADAPTTPEASRLIGRITVDGGQAVGNAPVRLLGGDGDLAATTTTDARGNYQFAVPQAGGYTIVAQARFSGGAEATGSVRANTGQGEGPFDLTLPNLDVAQLALASGTATGERVTIDGVPDDVTGIWAAPYTPARSDLLPGPLHTDRDSFASAGFVWFSATAQDGSDVTDFPNGLDVRIRLQPRQLPLMRDAQPGTARIEIPMRAFDDVRGLWQDEGDGHLVDENGVPIPESAQASLLNGSYSGPVFLRFTARHFSCWSFLAVPEPLPNDRGEADIAPDVSLATGRFTAGPNRPAPLLGQRVSGEIEPRDADTGDDGLLSCGARISVQASRRLVFGNDNRPAVYLQAFSFGPEIVDGQTGNNSGGFEFDRYTDEEWRVRNLRVDGFSAGILQSDYLTLPVTYRDGFLRLVVTDFPIADASLRPDGSASVDLAGEIEDYAPGDCAADVLISADGDDGARLVFESGAACLPGEDCDTRVGVNDDLTLRAELDGQPVDVEWVISRDFLAAPLTCADGPSCTIAPTRDGVLSLDPIILEARFPKDPRVSLSIAGGTAGSVTGTPGGLACGNGANDCFARLPADSTLTLSATAGEGEEFVGWERVTCLEGRQDAAQCTLDLQRDDYLNVFANFAAFPTLTVTPQSGGRVTSEPSGIDCAMSGDACTLRVPRGTSVELTAAPTGDSAFVSWGGACSDAPANVCTLTLEGEDLQTAANFQAGALIRVVTDGQGSITSTPAGIACTAGNQGDCDEPYVLNLTVDLSTQPLPGHVFTAWDDVCAGQFETCTFTVDQARTITASFRELFDVTATVTGDGIVDGPGIADCRANEAGTAECASEVADGDAVSFFATPLSGQTFVGWGGDCSAAGSATQCDLTITGDTAVSAEFAAVVTTFPLTLTVDGEPGTAGDNDEFLVCDSASSPCSENFEQGETVTLFAFADNTSHSFSWGGDCTGTADGADCTVTMNGPVEVTVTFFDPNAGNDDPTLFIDFTGAGSGIVTDDSGAIACNSNDPAFDCSASFPAGSSVSLSAGPASTGDVFIQWQGQNDCAANDPFNPVCTLRLTADTTVTAEFDSQGGGSGVGAMQLAANPPLTRTNDGAGSSLGVAIGFDSNTGEELVELVDHPDNAEVIELRPVDGTTAQVFAHQPSGFTLISPAEGTALSESGRQAVLVENTFGTVYQLSFDLLLEAGGNTLTLSNQDGFNCGASAADCP